MNNNHLFVSLVLLLSYMVSAKSWIVRANLKRTFEKLASLEPFCERFSTKNCNFAASNRTNDDTRKAKSDNIARRRNRS